MSLTSKFPPSSLRIEVNGEPRTIPTEATVRDLLVEMKIDPAGEGIAVARNLRIVRREDWAQARLMHDDRIEVVTATQGG